MNTNIKLIRSNGVLKNKPKGRPPNAMDSSGRLPNRDGPGGFEASGLSPGPENPP